MVGGNLEGETRTVSIDIYDQQVDDRRGGQDLALSFDRFLCRLTPGVCGQSECLVSMAAEIDIQLVKTFPVVRHLRLGFAIRLRPRPS